MSIQSSSRRNWKSTSHTTFDQPQHSQLMDHIKLPDTHHHSSSVIVGRPGLNPSVGSALFRFFNARSVTAVLPKSTQRRLEIDLRWARPASVTRSEEATS